MAKGVSRRGFSNSHLPTGIGYIFVPSDVPRDEFVKTCFRTEKVSIVIENGAGVAHGCLITKQALRDVRFPDAFEIDGKVSLGSTVVFITDLNSDSPIIIGVIANTGDATDVDEESFNITKMMNGTYIAIAGDAESGSISISSSATGDLGSLDINIVNENKTARLNVNVSGGINIFAEEAINIETNNTEINVKPGTTFNIGAENLEPMVLGDKNKAVLTDIKAILDDLRSSLSTFVSTNTAPAAVVGITGYPALGISLTTIASQISSVNTKIGEILSKVSNTE